MNGTPDSERIGLFVVMVSGTKIALLGGANDEGPTGPAVPAASMFSATLALSRNLFPTACGGPISKNPLTASHVGLLEVLELKQKK